MSVLLVLALAAGLAAFVVAPLLRADAASTEHRSAELSEARELQSRQDMLVAALKDLEDDRATDKVGAEDYAALKTRLTAEAVEVLQRADALEADRLESEARAARAAQPLRHPGARDPGRGR
jgi:hypothetical protein